MQIYKITDSKGDVYYSKYGTSRDLEKEGCKVETVEMSEEEYNAIPTTQSAAAFFKE